MDNPVYNYKIESLSLNCITSFLKEAVLDDCVEHTYIKQNLKKYAKKLYKKAQFVTCRNNENKICAFLAFYMNNSEFTYITFVSVLPIYKRQKIFSKMLLLLETKALCENYKIVKLEVAKSNLSAIKTYQNSEFEFEGETQKSYFMKKNCNENSVYKLANFIAKPPYKNGGGNSPTV